MITEPGLKEIVEELHGKTITATTDFSVVADSDFIVITVGTPLDNEFKPNTEYVSAASREVAKHLKKGQAIVLKSTIPPLTTENVVKPILEESGLVAGKDFHLAFSPERLAEGNALNELKNIPIVIGAVSKESAKVISELWNTLLGVETIVVSTPREAELAKLADNAFIDLNIALANELAIVCDGVNADVTEVIKAANSLKKGMHYVNILYPGIGVGGYCLTKDPWFLDKVSKDYGFNAKTFSAGRNANDFMPDYSVKKLKQAVGSLAGKKIAVLGLSFKANTGDLRYTPVGEVIKKLEAEKAIVAISDSRASEEEKQHVTQLPLLPVEEAIKNADVVAVLSPHKEFLSLDLVDLKKKSGAKWFFDGRNAFVPAAVRNAGFEYLGIGR